MLMESAGRREISSYPTGVARASHSKSSIWCVDCTGVCSFNGRSCRIDGPTVARPVTPSIHGLRDQERESGRNISWVAAAPHLPQGCTPICRTAHHQHHERRHVTGRRHPGCAFSKHWCLSSPISPPYTETCSEMYASLSLLGATVI